MPYRILVDENLDPRTAGLLRDRGHDAINVEAALGKGTADPAIARYAETIDALVLTNDADFLRPELREALSILYCPDNTMRAHRIATHIEDLAELVPNQDALPDVTWITETDRS